MEKEVALFSGNTKLNAVIEVPPDIELCRAKLPVVILCHGHSRHKNDGLDVLSHRLAARGFATLRFDFSGCGKQAENRYHLYCATEWMRDLHSAVSFASNFPFADKGRIGVAGISMGATLALCAAGVDKRIKSVASMAGIADCEEWLDGVWKRTGADFGPFRERLERARETAATTGAADIIDTLSMYNDLPSKVKNLAVETLFMDCDSNNYVTLDSIASLLELKALRSCPYITCPVFYLHGKEDDLVPEQYAHDMHAKTVSKKKLSVYEGIDHNIPAHPKRDLVFEDIASWFEDTLQ